MSDRLDLTDTEAKELADVVVNHIGEHLTPADVFDDYTLEKWAEDNGYVPEGDLKDYCESERDEARERVEELEAEVDALNDRVKELEAEVDR